jgi:hypothetical protein
MISELSNPSYIGTALALQTAIGFIVANLSIWLIPIAVYLTGWAFGFMFLVLDPLFGIFSLYNLRKEQDSIKLAQGKN